jgi:hypothetical protein
MIMILFNLAFIPDSVVHHVDMNFEPGWQHYFKMRMASFQEWYSSQVGNTIEYELVEYTNKKKKISKTWFQDVSQMEEAENEYPGLVKTGKTHTLTYDHEWKFQDEELEARYLDFKN